MLDFLLSYYLIKCQKTCPKLYFSYQDDNDNVDDDDMATGRRQRRGR